MSKGKNNDERYVGLNDAMSGVRKQFGDGAIMRMDEDGQRWHDVIRTGSLALDEALGTGGYPRGRIIEIFGPESSGKTTLTLHAIAEAQRAGGVAAFIDAEHAFDLRYARAIGVDGERLLVSQPDNGEQALDIAEFLAKSASVDLIVIDSVAALVPKAEIEGEMGEQQMGLQARLMGRAMRKLAAICSKSSTTIIFINQLRHKIGVVFGNPETTPGGQAMKFFCSIRLDVRRTGKAVVGDTVIGNRTRVKVVKNKCSPPFQEAEFDIRWGTGVDAPLDLIETALAQGVLDKSGAHVRLSGKSIGQGKEKAREALLADTKLASSIRQATLAKLPSYAHLMPKAGAGTGAKATPTKQAA